MIFQVSWSKMKPSSGHMIFMIKLQMLKLKLPFPGADLGLL